MFKETTTIEIILNQFYEALSNENYDEAINLILNRYKTTSLKTEVLQVENVLMTYRFVLKKDFWGPKEVLMFQTKGDSFDYLLSYSTRNPEDYYPVATSLIQDGRNFERDDENQNIFRLKYSSLIFSIKESIIVLKKDHSQHYEVTAIVIK